MSGVSHELLAAVKDIPQGVVYFILFVFAKKILKISFTEFFQLAVKEMKDLGQGSYTVTSLNAAGVILSALFFIVYMGYSTVEKMVGGSSQALFGYGLSKIEEVLIFSFTTMLFTLLCVRAVK